MQSLTTLAAINLLTEDNLEDLYAHIINNTYYYIMVDRMVETVDIEDFSAMKKIIAFSIDQLLEKLLLDKELFRFTINEKDTDCSQDLKDLINVHFNNTLLYSKNNNITEELYDIVTKNMTIDEMKKFIASLNIRNSCYRYLYVFDGNFNIIYFKEDEDDENIQFINRGKHTELIGYYHTDIYSGYI